MNKLLILIVFVSFNSFGQNIEWSTERKLSWQDFKATPHDTSNVIAVTFCGISFETLKVSFWNGKGTYQVKCIFYPDSSWYLSNKVDSLTLLHEQTHFYIAAVYTRKIQGELDKERLFPNHAKKLYETLMLEYESMQRKYDLQTNHGILPIEQKRWTQKILTQLND